MPDDYSAQIPRGSGLAGLVVSLLLMALTSARPCLAQAQEPQPEPATLITPVVVEEEESADLQEPYPTGAGQLLTTFGDEGGMAPSLEELMSVQVTSLAGVARDWSKTPAAMDVLTNETINRSGHLVLPEVLRLSPGVFVGRFNAQAWYISPRGFNSQGANKSLVLIDGRIAYDPLFSGALWDSLDLVLEDLDRIEVIRGPGPTLWGSNAVNGVINVTTRSAKLTQGLYTTGVYGNDLSMAAVRYGDRLSDNAWYRVWGKYYQHDAFELPGSGDGHDDWSIGRGGFRVDGEGEEHTTWTVDGGVYNTFTKGEFVSVPAPAPIFTQTTIKDARISGGYLSFRVVQEQPQEHEGWSFQTYYDQATRVTNADFQTERHSIVADWRHHFRLNDQHELIWGLHGWVNTDESETDGFSTTYVTDESRTMTTFSGFVQDTITLKPDALFLMLGSKLEWNDRTGVEVQPGVRAWWTPDDRQMLWAAVTRAVRLPSRLEEDGLFPVAYAGDTPLALTGSRDLEAEELIAYEVGYRTWLRENVSLSTAIFYNDYDRLITIPASVVGDFTNEGEGQTYGGEIAATWQPADNWRLETSYSLVRLHITEGPFPGAHEGHTPQHQVTFRSFLDLTPNVQFNTLAYYTDTIPAVDADAHIRLDLGLSWQVNENLQVSLWGQDLLDHSHQEYLPTNENERTVYLQVTAEF